MSRIYLERMVENLPEDCLPANWSDFDLAEFSLGKRLWDYQQTALRNALLALWKYYNEPAQSESERKQAFMKWYRDFGLDASLDLALDRSSAAKRKLTSLPLAYYSEDENGHLPYEQFINRMSFWMATGSGKTLVLVKLIEILRVLMQRGEIPTHDILVLTYRDDLIEQLRGLVDDFNANGGLYIRLRELREYTEVKREYPSLFSGQEINVYYYRSDNLSDEQKEKIINFRNYENNGEWYLLLDEAHKGDKEESKPQYIFSILSRNGFMFNFSATFVDERDIVTTVANYNLSEFVLRGHGKHIRVLDQAVRGFKVDKDFDDNEKQTIVLKALILLTYTRQFEARVRKVRGDLYHRPLLMTLVNSVNTEDADLKLFFRELARIGKGEIDPAVWEKARQELLEELCGGSEYLFESGQRFKVDAGVLEKLSQVDMLRAVFNAPSHGEIEVLVRPSNQQEVAFKLRTSDDPFALVRIGVITEWLKRELSGYEINQHFTDEGFFESLNRPESDINLLLGSRSFYEGWDSNRPNVIMYINIGTAVDAKKFILQSVGRGVRIEPLKDQRKRLGELIASGLPGPEETALLEKIKDQVQPLESLFIFGTNREALNVVIGELKQEEKSAGVVEIALEVNHEAVDGKLLLIPTYSQRDQPLYGEQNLIKFQLTKNNLQTLKNYLAYVDDDRVFYALHGTAPREISVLRNSMEKEESYRTDGNRPYRNMGVLVRQAANFFGIYGKRFSEFRPLEDEINHFKHIKVALEKIGDLEQRIQRVIDGVQAMKEARSRYDAGQMTVDELLEENNRLKQAERYYVDNTVLEIKRIANHYYIPVLLSENERIDYIRSVIHVASEVAFLKVLDDYIALKDNDLKSCDWWLFSRVEERSDDINIPYYYPLDNRIANFKPDFIFWMKKGNRYRIVFIDPKGTGRSEYEHKVDGYKHLFEENGKPIIFHHQGMDVSVHLFLYTIDRQIVAGGYQAYWVDSMKQVMEALK